MVSSLPGYERGMVMDVDPEQVGLIRPGADLSAARQFGVCSFKLRIQPRNKHGQAKSTQW
jgi:hypothetical protein